MSSSTTTSNNPFLDPSAIVSAPDPAQYQQQHHQHQQQSSRGGGAPAFHLPTRSAGGIGQQQQQQRSAMMNGGSSTIKLVPQEQQQQQQQRPHSDYNLQSSQAQQQQYHQGQMAGNSGGGGGGGDPYATVVQQQGRPLGPTSATAANERQGQVAPGRGTFSRTMTASSTGSSKPLPAVHRSRRSMSTDSADSTGRRAEAIDTISARLHNVSLVPVQQKVGSKHADVIDAWDGTGIGLAKWHHAGPYDAAAPSRNKQVTGGGGSAGSRSGGGGGGGHHDTRAPMAAFGSSERVPQVPTKGGADSPGSAPSDVLDGLVPELPSSKPMTSPPAAATSPSSKLSQRAQAALRQRGGMGGLGQTSPGYGSLQDPYSSSLPSSGGYFVAASVGAAAAAEGGANGAGGLPSSGSTNALAWDEQEERRRRKEEKKRALKAAWGIDEPEPFEEFGASPTEANTYLNDEHSPLPAFARGGRSPGLRPGGRSQSIGGNGDPSPAEIASSPGSEYFGATGGDGVSPGGTRGQGAGGVKRTRSIMQRFKAMRDNPNVPPPEDTRAPSPGSYQPWKEDTLGIGTADPTPAPAADGPTLRPRRRSFLGSRKSRIETSSAPFNAQVLSPDNEREEILTGEMDMDEKIVPPTSSSNGYAELRSPEKVSRNGTRQRSKTTGDKALPAPPPPEPVMPDYGDYDSRPSSNSGGSGVQRKSSLMKRVKDRITR